jgi:3-deoxy-manno-octulosonate cytidylyltransferase (CMP-KDO synthetase)
MNTAIIIPARYGSTRFPGKPLAPVAGVPLLQRVWALGVSVAGKEGVTVATDDARIADFCAEIGASCVMTDKSLPTGTERVRAALQKLSLEIVRVINLQGDAVLTPPWVIRAVMDEMEREPSIGVFTPAVRMTVEAFEKMRAAKEAGEVGGTMVVFGKSCDALYFSKSVIPFVREKTVDIPVYRHIGLYGYRRDTLSLLAELPRGPLEEAEGLEQLRALENSVKVRVVVVDYRGRSHTGVDSEADVRRAEAIIAAEGELLPVYNGSYRFPS